MCAKIFVGNLHADANKQELSDLFARYSTVRSIHFSEGLFNNATTNTIPNIYSGSLISFK